MAVAGGRPTHHREGGGFRNPWLMAPVERGFRDFLRWQRERRTRPPRSLPGRLELPVATPQFALPRARTGELRATWVGHSTFLLQIGRWNVLTDPVWSDRVSPLPWLGPRRLVRPGIPFDGLPPIDVIVISHDHYDHLDAPTVRALTGRFPDARWVAPLGHANWLARRGARTIDELDWWTSVRLEAEGASLEITALPAQHWTRRNPFVESRRLWAGFGLDGGPGRRVFFAGDSGYGEAFREIGRRAGPFDVVLLPIGAYEPRWFMSGAHMDPAEAVQAYIDLGSTGSFVAMHWGTFILTDEPVLEPPRLAREAWAASGLPPANLSILRHGETLIRTG